MLCWIDAAPKTEGITDGVAQVPSKAVQIQSEGGILKVEGIDDGTQVAVYTPDGKQAGSAVCRNGAALVGTSLQSGNTAIVKIGVTVDEEYRKDGEPGREHMWFEVKKINEDSIEAELTNDPYYVSSIKKGDVATYPIDMITDWILFTKDYRITPDDVYLLDN